MANGGWYGTDEEWRRLEAPLLMADDVLERFAAVHGVPLTRNSKDWPERAFVFAGDPRCLMQLYLAEAEALTWNLWLCCSQDRGDSRFWRREFAFENQQMEQVISRLPQFLETGLATLRDWAAAPEQLEFATKLAPLPGY